ncbi:hypothetical protein GCM10009624_20140 [Gordonia sinesedis]
MNTDEGVEPMIAIDIVSVSHRAPALDRLRGHIRVPHASPMLKAVLFVVGCVLLTVAAMELGNLGGWIERWGTAPVLAGFAIVIALGAYCFWSGARTIVGLLIGG